VAEPLSIERSANRPAAASFCNDPSRGRVLRFDLVVIGGGLSGAALVRRLAARGSAERPLSICVLDARGLFGRGVAYSLDAPAGALLIEPIATSTPREFQAWLQRLAERPARAGGFAGWIDQHHAALVAGEFANLHCPRALFGLFSEQLWQATLEKSTVDVCCLARQAVDLTMSGSDYSILLDDGRRIEAPLTTLAVGAIPRVDFATPSARYIADPYERPFGHIEAQIRSAQGREVEIAIIGGNASALEMIHLLATVASGDKRIGITCVSTSGGLLPGGIDSSTRARKITPEFPSAPEYLASAEQAVRAGSLRTMKGSAERPRIDGDQLCIPIGDGRSINADMVIDCRGAGRLGSTSSKLLQSICDRGVAVARSGGKGFATSGSSFQARPGLFTIGPILNGDGPGTYVESILTVDESARGAAAEMAPLLETLPGYGVVTA